MKNFTNLINNKVSLNEKIFILIIGLTVARSQITKIMEQSL